jgi:two-component system, OmpR family, sensor histidine kinase QseC
MTFRLVHLAVLLAATTVLAAVAGVVATYRVADEELRDVLDEDLESQSRMLAKLLAGERTRPSREELASLLRRTFEADDEDTLWVNVYDLRTGGHASNLKHDLALTDDDSGPVRLQRGRHAWTGYQRRQDDLVVQLLRRDDLYEEVQQEMLDDVVAPAIAGGAVNLLLLAGLMTLLLWPLTRLVRELGARDADSLAPFTLRTPATEIATLRDTLNGLIARVRAVLEREREFTSDVAHELRTPLTTLKLELASPEPDLAAMRSEVDRLARLVGQLLTLARLEERLWKERFGTVELGGVARRELERHASRLAAKRMTVRADLAHARVRGDTALLEMLVQNLLDNVAVHCPAGTAVDVRVQERDGRALLVVSDTGHGIPEPLRARMTERWSRLDSKSEGLGVGLAICQKIVRAHGGSLAMLARPDGAPGLHVEAAFEAVPLDPAG